MMQSQFKPSPFAAKSSAPSSGQTQSTLSRYQPPLQSTTKETFMQPRTANPIEARAQYAETLRASKKKKLLQGKRERILTERPSMPPPGKYVRYTIPPLDIIASLNEQGINFDVRQIIDQEQQSFILFDVVEEQVRTLLQLTNKWYKKSDGMWQPKRAHYAISGLAETYKELLEHYWQTYDAHLQRIQQEPSINTLI